MEKIVSPAVIGFSVRSPTPRRVSHRSGFQCIRPGESVWVGRGHLGQFFIIVAVNLGQEGKIIRLHPQPGNRFGRESADPVWESNFCAHHLLGRFLGEVLAR